jgi:hypothetical protein
MTIRRKLKPFASETRLDDLALAQNMATEVCPNDRKAFFDHAVARSFRRTVVVSHSGLVGLAPQDALPGDPICAPLAPAYLVSYREEMMEVLRVGRVSVATRGLVQVQLCRGS